MNRKKVRVRFSPSPTGELHIGGARTALYNFLFSKVNNGQFILRIEDTDKERSSDESMKNIMDSLTWLGIKFNEGLFEGGSFGPYKQTQREEIYQRYLDLLVSKGLAYPCFLQKEELDNLRKKALDEKKSPHFYLNKYRDLDKQEAEKLKKEKTFVYRVKNPQKELSFVDGVKGKVSFPPDMIGDFVIARSDGSFVYDFCCVIDDHLMEISHVIRGTDHVNNTSKQLLLYDLLGFSLPSFTHVSLLLNKDGKKMSKRDNAVSVFSYKKEGILPQALNNYLALLGWSHPEDKTIFDVMSLDSFDMSRLQSSGAFFDVQKLNFINKEWLNQLEDNQYFSWLKNSNLIHGKDDSWIKAFSSLSKQRVANYTELKDLVDQFTLEKVEFPEEGNLISKETIDLMKNKVLDFIKTQELSEDSINSFFKGLSKDMGLKGKDFYFPLRGLLFGQTSGPDMKQMLLLMDKSLLIKRLS